MGRVKKEKLAKAVRSYRAVAYFRLSKEDGDKEESNSIRGQREAISRFLQGRPEITLVGEQADDGWSGANFDRPGFLSVMEAVDSGEADCILVKDLSRFGRNYIEAGRYIEEIFPRLGVRFIAVNDGYDSGAPKNKTDNILIPFKNLVNDAYCRDISAKIRSQFEVKRRKGDFIGSYAPYGYAKDPENHNRLAVDAYAAEIVRSIFGWKIQGMSLSGIAKRLNGTGVLSPAAYKKAMGLSFGCGWQTKEETQWGATAVGGILRNEVYLGTVVQGKYGTPNFRVKERTPIPPAEWVRVENCQEPIVTKECFGLAQRMLGVDSRIPEGKETVCLFSGFLLCGDCGGGMTRQKTSVRGKQYVYEMCAGHKKQKAVCSAHTIEEKCLEQGILEPLQSHLSLLNQADLAALKTVFPKPGGRREKALRSREQELYKASYQKAALCRAALYADYQEGLLDRAEYEELKQVYTDQCDRLRALLAEREAEPPGPVRETSGIRWLSRFLETGEAGPLERSFLASILESALVHEGKRMELRFRYQAPWLNAEGAAGSKDASFQSGKEWS